MRNHRLLTPESAIRMGVVALLLTSPLAAAVQVTGRLVDGTAMFRQSPRDVKLDGVGFSESAERVPLAGENFRLTLVGDDAGAGSWLGKTDESGRFTLTLEGLQQIPVGAALVASVNNPGGSRPSHHSLPVGIGDAAEVEFRLYNTTDNASFLQGGQLGVVLGLVDGPDSSGKLLKVRVTLMVSNIVGDLYVGRPLNPAAPRSTRACFRFRLPGVPGKDFQVVKNEAAGGGNPFTITADGWAILDSPIPPYPEASTAVPPEGRRGVRYDLHYVVPASQEMVLPFPIDLSLNRMYVLGVAEDIALSTLPPPDGRGGLEKAPNQQMADPESGEPKEWVILLGKEIATGSVLPVVVSVDSILLGQVNHGSLKVLGGFIIGCIIALLVGLMLGRRGPRMEAVLSEATGEEIIERIAQLDAQFKKGLVAKVAYQETRERLLSLARYEVPEFAGQRGADAATADAGSPDAALPPEALDLVERIREIEAASSTDSKSIQERLLLLEELARVLVGTSVAPAASREGRGS